MSILHAAVGQFVHLRGRPWLYYVYGRNEHHLFPIRHDLFGFANYAGVGAFLIVTALLATSNDYSLRALGTPRWKSLQRWNYALFALSAFHAVGYLVIERQKFPFVALTALCLIIVIAFQAIGYTSRRVLKKENRQLN